MKINKYIFDIYVFIYYHYYIYIYIYVYIWGGWKGHQSKDKAVLKATLLGEINSKRKKLQCQISTNL